MFPHHFSTFYEVKQVKTNINQGKKPMEDWVDWSPLSHSYISKILMVFLARRWRKPSWRKVTIRMMIFLPRRRVESNCCAYERVLTGESGRCGLCEDQSWTESWQMVTGERAPHTPSADGRMVNINNKEHQQYTISTPARSSLIPTLLHHGWPPYSHSNTHSGALDR